MRMIQKDNYIYEIVANDFLETSPSLLRTRRRPLDKVFVESDDDREYNVGIEEDKNVNSEEDSRLIINSYKFTPKNNVLLKMEDFLPSYNNKHEKILYVHESPRDVKLCVARMRDKIGRRVLGLKKRKVDSDSEYCQDLALQKLPLCEINRTNIIALTFSNDEEKKIRKLNILSNNYTRNIDTCYSHDDSIKSYQKNSESQDEETSEDHTDQAELEAGSVLQEANSLSTRLLNTMDHWVHTGKYVSKGDSTEICISNEKYDDDIVKTTWISQDKIRSFCPNLKLADYQLLGVNWMALLYGMKCSIERSNGNSINKLMKNEKRGGNGMNVNGVLADEMGLGKTIQTIAFLAWLKQKESREFIRSYCKPHIIIVPASVLSNWLRELKMFCPSMIVVTYHGSVEKRNDVQKRLRKSFPTNGKNRTVLPIDIVLTTFSYFSSQKSSDRDFLRIFDWNYMVVDEAHFLKNPRAARYKNLDKFKTERRLLLTGTPVQNSPRELMSLLCFLMPLFTRKKTDFANKSGRNDGGVHMLEYFVLLDKMKEKKPNSNCSSSLTLDEYSYKNLKQLFAPFVLRRKKVEVLNQLIPPKTTKLEVVPFDKSTKRVYDSILLKHIQSGTNKSTKYSYTQNHIFTDLRKAANHPLLLRTKHKREEEKEHLSRQMFHCGYFGKHETCTLTLVKKELDTFSDYDIHCAAQELIHENHLRSYQLSRYILQENDLYCSPKMVRLRTLLPQLSREGHRMLIFSQWTRCLDLLGCLMELIEFKYLRLDGSTEITERQRIIDEFNFDSSIPVFLLSTRAGGMGINLTAADTCILHDLDFNPFNDLQAEDRCHRIGQRKPVTIIKMMTEGTVDHDIYKMQIRKSKMNAAILEKKQFSHSSATSHINHCQKVSDENDEICSIVETAMDRYLSSKYMV